MPQSNLLTFTEHMFSKLPQLKIFALTSDSLSMIDNFQPEKTLNEKSQ